MGSEWMAKQIMTSPGISRADVKRLQAAINNRLRSRGRKPIKVDGVYGVETADAAYSVAYMLGVDFGTLRQMDRRGVTAGVRRIIRRPGLRSPAQLARARSRKRYLAKQQATGVAAALKYAARYVGTVERPANSNRGKKIDEWQRAVDMIGQPWCGAFVAACLRAGGVTGVSWRMRYCPYIVADGRAGVNGLKRVRRNKVDVQPGDLVLFDFHGSGIAQHVAIAISTAKNGSVKTREGNTSAGSSGSQDNGGGVFERTRPLTQVLAVVEPRYPS